MAQYVITGPDGNKYNVTAPDNASQDDIINYAKNQFSQVPQSIPELKKDIPHQIAAGVLSFGQGGMPVFDEAGAGAGAALEKAGVLPSEGNSDETYGQIYDRRLQNIRNVEKSFSQQHPILDPALRIGGAIASLAALPEGVMAKMATRPITSSAAIGGLQGFTGGEGGIGNRAGNAATNAALAAGTTAILGKLFPANPIDKETKLFTQKLEESGISPQQYADAMKNSSADDFAAELGGENLKNIALKQAKINTPALHTARQSLRERILNAPQRAENIVQENIMPSNTLDNMVGNIDEMASKLGPMYKQVDAQLVPRNDFADTLYTKEGKAALKDVANKMNAKGISLKDAGLLADKNGNIFLSPKVPIGTLREAQDSLKQQISRDSITGKVNTDDNWNAIIEGMRQKITSGLEKNSDLFKKTNAIAAGKLQAESAMDMGQKLAKTASSDVAEKITERADKVFSPNELSYQKAGFQKGLIDAMKNSPAGEGNPISRISANRVFDRASDVLDSPVAANKFRDAVIAERERMAFANRALQNSVTAEAMPTQSLSGFLKSPFKSASDKFEQMSTKRLAEMLYATSPEAKAKISNSVLRATGNYKPTGKELSDYLRNRLLPSYAVESLGGQ